MSCSFWEHNLSLHHSSQDGRGEQIIGRLPIIPDPDRVIGDRQVANQHPTNQRGRFGSAAFTCYTTQL